MVPRCCLALLFCCLFAFAPAQESPLRFERVEGLSQSTAYAITKDKQGFLWIATGNGLNRFDGREMKVYKPGPVHKAGQMQGRVIRSRLVEDGQERIWFSTDLSLHFLSKRKEKFTACSLTTDESKTAASLFGNPVLLQNDQLWLAHATEGVYLLHTVTGKSVRYPVTEKDEAGNVINLMYHGAYDGRENLWFATNKGLLRFSLTTKKWHRLWPGRSLYSLSFCNDTLYISEGKKVRWLHTLAYSQGEVAFAQEPAGTATAFIHCLYADGSGTLWAGDEKGNVYSKTGGPNSFQWRGNINGNDRPRSHYPVYCFYADNDGLLWVGAYTLGLLRADVSQPGFKNYPTVASSEAGLFVNTIYEDERENVWMGSFENGIVVQNKKTGAVTSLRLPYKGPRLIYGNSVPLIQEDSKGNVWTSLSGSLFVREKSQSRFTAIKIPSPSNALQVPQLWSLCEYGGGWLLGTTTGLYRLVKTGAGYALSHLGCFGLNRIVSLWASPEGQLWVALESGGVAVASSLAQVGEARRLFAQANVKTFLHDEKHRLLWMATAGGLIAYHLPTGRYRYFTEEDGLLNSYTNGVLQNGNDLWVSTNYGLSKATLSFTPQSPLPRARFLTFTTADGLPDNLLNAKACYKGRSGIFYFGTPKGVVSFRPSAIGPAQHVPVVRLTDLLVNDEKADTATAPEYITQLTLPYSRNSLFLRFRGIDYKDGATIQYAYRLDGWDKTWIYSRQLNEVRYNHLPPGRYVFHVKAANSTGVWTGEAHTVSIHILPPFWKQWWFYTLAALLALATAILITRVVVGQKLRRHFVEMEKQWAVEAERNRISKDMHDEIGSGLTHIALLSELMKMQKKDSPELLKEADDIATSARRLVTGMSEIIWALNPHNDTLENLLAYLREQTVSYFEPFAIDYAIHFPDEVPVVKLRNEQRRNLFLVAKEALNNALKHSGASSITLALAVDNGSLCFCVSDNGKGFAGAKAKAASNGLKNMRRRMEEIGGTFELHTGSNGTLIRFSLPAVIKPQKKTTTFFTSFGKKPTATFETNDIADHTGGR